MALIANVNRDPKKHPKPYSAMDFMPKWDKMAEEKPQQTVEEQKSIMFALIDNLKKKKK